MKTRDAMTRPEALTALARLHRWICEDDTPQATHALLRLTWSHDVSLARDVYARWDAKAWHEDRLSAPLPGPRNAPDALRVAVAWWLKQPAFVEAKVIVRKTRATKRGAYLQLMVTTALHQYEELVYLSCNEDGKDVKCLPGPAAADRWDLMSALDPRLLIAMGQEHLYTRDLYTLGTHLLTQAGGTLYWPGIWRLPLEAAQRVREQLETLKPLLASGSVTCDLVPVCDGNDDRKEEPCPTSSS